MDFENEKENAGRRLFAVLFIAAVMGALVGGVRMPTWHVAVESAQVLAGLVVYPPENPFYLYHATTWTALHQLTALFLMVVPSEWAASLLISAGLTALTFSAIALTAYAFWRRTMIALFAPLFAFAIFGGSDVYGVVYPVYLAGTHHTYGVAGRGLALLIVALIGLRRFRAAAFLLGVFPAVHLTWAAFTWGVVGASVLVGWRVAWTKWTEWTKWTWGVFGAFAVGGLLAGMSFVVQRVFIAPDVVSGSEATRPLVDAFLAYWDVHRQAVDFITAPGLALAVVGTAICFTIWVRGGHRRRDVALLLAIAGVLGMAGVLFTRVQGFFPIAFQLAMPGRFINLMLLALPAVLLGATARNIERPWARVILCVLLVYPVVTWAFRRFLSSDRFGWDLPHFAILMGIGVAVFVGVLMWPRPASAKPKHETLFADAAPATFSVLLLAGIFAFTLYPRATGLSLEIDPALEHLRDGRGTVIAPSATELLQLRTRRPVLVNTGALDQLPYVPASAQGMREILLRVYGVDLLEPPVLVRELRPGALPLGIENDVWTARTRAEWNVIGEEFDAWTVLARTDIELDLPLKFESEAYRVYSIPKQRKNSAETP